VAASADRLDTVSAVATAAIINDAVDELAVVTSQKAHAVAKAPDVMVAIDGATDTAPI
jgi:molybdopterin-binding protein